jgi:hypothetical protein
MGEKTDDDSGVRVEDVVELAGAEDLCGIDIHSPVVGPPGAVRLSGRQKKSDLFMYQLLVLQQRHGQYRSWRRNSVDRQSDDQADSMGFGSGDDFV